MDKLLLFIGEDKKFDQGEVVEKLSSVAGAFNCREGKFIGSVFECEYPAGGSPSIIVRLTDDLETIAIQGAEEESLRLALIFNELLGGSLSVIDMDYSFHIDLTDVKTVDDLRQRITSDSE